MYDTLSHFVSICVCPSGYFLELFTPVKEVNMYVVCVYASVVHVTSRPVEDSSQPPGRGVLSMQGLSYGVVRVDTEERLSVLTVQDVGTVTPGGTVEFGWSSQVSGLEWGS